MRGPLFGDCQGCDHVSEVLPGVHGDHNHRRGDGGAVPIELLDRVQTVLRT
jgi:hypothetical protein